MEHEKVKVLDHGYCQLVETWGSDESIVTAARMSTGKGFLGWGPKLSHYNCPVHGDKQTPVCCESAKRVEDPGDEKLLRYLWENKHESPFEFAGMVIEVMAPILVFREWHRHRVQAFNEMSARYTPLPDVNYVPSVERLMVGSDGKNKQAGTIKGAAVLTERDAVSFQEGLRLIYQQAEALYQTALANGVPKELARVHLPVGRYSRMRATSNLRNWLGFLKLRMATTAQFEIRAYACEVGKLIERHFPRTWSLFNVPK